MAGTLQIKGGLLADIGVLADREPYFATDVPAFYLGQSSGINKAFSPTNKQYFAKFDITPGATPTITATAQSNTLGITPTVTITSTSVTITATGLITAKTFPQNSILVDSENSYYYMVISAVATPNGVVLTFNRTTDETSIDFTALTEPIEFYFGFTIFP